MTGVDSQTGDRSAHQRGAFLAQRYDLREPVALALAYRERGWSHAGIAKKVDMSEATIASYMADLTDRFGPAVVETKLPSELATHPVAPLLPAHTRTNAEVGGERR